MGVGDDDDEDWNSESGEDDGDCEGRHDDVELIETPSPAAGSAEPILHFPERSEDNTAWLFPEGVKSASDVNKMKPETLAIHELITTSRTSYEMSKFENSNITICLRREPQIFLLDFQNMVAGCTVVLSLG